MARFKSPLARSAWSRTISALRRCPGPRASKRLRGSFSRQFGCRFRALAIRRAEHHFAQQRLHIPVKIVLKCSASQSSSSG
jgi:hypothetical protein